MRSLTLIVAAVTALVGCSSLIADPSATVRPTFASPDLAQGLSPLGPTEIAVVDFVVDGDTIQVHMNGDEFNELSVRYIGIDAPEREAEPLWQESTEANRDLVEGMEVFLEPDESGTDQFGRLLRHVWLPTNDGWLNVNSEIVRLGMADARSYPPDTLWDPLYASAESEARAAELGMWADRGGLE
jgi:micrococcal nuclease